MSALGDWIDGMGEPELRALTQGNIHPPPAAAVRWLQIEERFGGMRTVSVVLRRANARLTSLVLVRITRAFIDDGPPVESIFPASADG